MNNSFPIVEQIKNINSAKNPEELKKSKDELRVHIKNNPKYGDLKNYHRFSSPLLSEVLIVFSVIFVFFSGLMFFYNESNS